MVRERAELIINQWVIMNWWFKKHPELLERESRLLDSNSNYKESFRCRDNLLLSTGEIIVRLDGTTKHPVLLLYPESTPFSLPKVFLLNNVIGKEELLSLSAMPSAKVGESIKSNIKFYNYWHQSPDGSLCLLEADNLEKYGEYFTISDVINRARDWLAGIVTGNVSFDTPEVELFGHFRFKIFQYEFLLPESFYADEIVQGEFYSVLYSHIYKEVPELEKRLYIGAVIVGERNSGIVFDPVQYQNQLMPLGLQTPLEIFNNKILLKDRIEKQEIIKTYWWQVDSLKPFASIFEMAELIGNGNTDKGYQKIQQIAGSELKALPDDVFFSIRYKNSKGENQFQSFRLKKINPNAVTYLDSTLDGLKKTLENYDINAVKCSSLTENRFFLRNSGRAERNILKEKSITILGCGALGSEIADSISKAGVDELTVVDFERMKFDNSIRHVAGVGLAGLAKVDAMQLHILQHNPFAKIQKKHNDIMNSAFGDYFSYKSIGISSIADDNIEIYVNEQAVISNEVVFYSRALRGAKAARIFRVIPGKDACFNCLSLYSDSNQAPFIRIPSDETLPTIVNECNNPIRPASAADLKLIAAITSRIVLDFLQKPDESMNHWIWSSEKISETSISNPFRVYPSFIPIHPDCSYCKPEPKKEVIIDNSVLNAIRDETKQKPKIETGGVLLGKLNDDKKVEIKFASGPGPNAVRTETEFIKDIKFSQTFIDEHYKNHGTNAAYIGEWHYHPSNDNRPSHTDIKSLSNIANGMGYLTEHPIMVILSNSGEASCSVHPVRKSYYFSELKTN